MDEAVSLDALLDRVSRLQRQVDRERARRQAAEAIGEQATGELFDTVQELRRVQSELLEISDRERVVAALARDLRQDLDLGRLLGRAARGAGLATLVDRCQIHREPMGDGAAVLGDWVQPTSDLPPAVALWDAPPPMRAALERLRPNHQLVHVEDVLNHPALTEEEARLWHETTGLRAVLAVPMRMGSHVHGWLVVGAVHARVWNERERDILQQYSHELGAAILQAQAYEHQRASMHRLQELDRAKDAFVSTVSHELRTPLTSIAGYVELMIEGGLGDCDRGVLDGLDVISRNTERLRSLVEDLLTLSVYDAPEMTLRTTPVDLEGLITDCQRAVLSMLVRRDLELDVLVDPDLAPVEADRTHLERVVLNLLSNAVKFTPDGGRVEVRVQRASGNEGAGGVLVLVTDTGIGIPHAEQQHLFTRFFRSSTSVEQEIQGTGLGLALSRRIVERHGGTIEVDSVEQRGTTVRVWLPS